MFNYHVHPSAKYNPIRQTPKPNTLGLFDNIITSFIFFISFTSYRSLVFFSPNLRLFSYYYWDLWLLTKSLIIIDVSGCYSIGACTRLPMRRMVSDCNLFFISLLIGRCKRFFFWILLLSFRPILDLERSMALVVFEPEKPYLWLLFLFSFSYARPTNT